MPSVASPLAALRDALTGLTQSHRLLQQHVAPDAPASVRSMVPYQFAGSEAICGGCDYRLQSVCPVAPVSLKHLLGLPMSVSVATDDGGRRIVSGVVHRVEVLVADGSTSLVEVGLCDALGLMRRRRNRRICRDLSTVDAVARILTEHLQANAVIGRSFRFDVARLRRTYPERALIHQAGESDAGFIERLLKQEGIAWHFTHSLDDGQPVHTLVLSDDTDAFAASPAGTVRFHRADASEAADTVVAWQPWRELAPGASARGQFDYKAVRVCQSDESLLLDQGPQGDDLARTLTDYRYDEPVLAAGAQHQEQMSRARIQAHEYAGKGFRGESVVRAFASGTRFVLDGHDAVDRCPAADRQFTLTRLQLYARNGVAVDEPLGRRLFEGWRAYLPRGDARDAGDPPPYWNSFECVRARIPVVPVFDPDADVPRIPFMTATVANENGQELDVDALGRVCVRFPFSHDDPATRHPGGAPARPLDSARVRVLQTLAGPGFGAAHWPRDGMEVMLGFDQGHPDRAFIVGMPYNGRQAPAQVAHRRGTPNNAALTSLRTKEVGGSRYNHLSFGDFAGKLGVQLATDHAATQLNQGWLGTAFDEGASQPRGEGFELATGAAGALRTGRGLLLSAFGRLQADGKQLDRQETLELMQECMTLFTELGRYAAEHDGMPLDTQGQADQQTRLRDWEQGSNTRPGGQGGAPMVAITAPDGLHHSTPASVVTHAGRNIDTVAVVHVQTTSGGRHVTNAGQGVSTFAQSGGIRTVAHQGDHVMQSQHASTFVQSAMDLGLSAGKKGSFVAAEEILLGEKGGAYLRLSGGQVEIGAPAGFRVRASGHLWEGPASGGVDLPAFGIGELSGVPALVRATDGEPVPNVRFDLERSASGPASGTTDTQGRATRTVTRVMETIKVIFKPRRGPS